MSTPICSTETDSGFNSSSFSSGSGDAYRPLSSLKRPGNGPPRGRSTEDARHAFHREPAGGQQPKAKAGASPPVHRWKPDGDPASRKYSMPGPSRKIAVVLDDSTTESSETSESDSTETGSGFDSSSFSSGSGDAYRPLSSLKRPGNGPPRGRSTEDARHAFHREPAGGQQPKAKAGASPPVHRWKPDGDPAVHLGSISFFSGTETVTLADATPHNPGGRCEPHETAANLCHAAPNKRWCDAAFAPVIFEFPQPVSVTAYMFTTAYCDPSKDPICWVLSGANEPDTSSSDQNSGSDENAPAAASSKTLRSRRASSPLGHAGRASPTSILKSPTAQASPASAWPEDVFSLDRSSSCKAKQQQEWSSDTLSH
eukprot:gene3822-5959_t